MRSNRGFDGGHDYGGMVPLRHRGAREEDDLGMVQMGVAVRVGDH